METPRRELHHHEISALAQILKRCNLWQKIKPYYFPLEIARWSPTEVLSEADEADLFKKAAEAPEAKLAYWIACITNNTTASGIELRGLRLKNIFLRPPNEISEIYIPPDAVKNTSRPRMIALNSTARWAVEQCYKRALRLGACEDDHYLFPFRKARGKYEPGLPPSRWFHRNSWNKLRKATGYPHIKPHGLRFQCITRLLEAGVEPEKVQAIAGHVDERSMRYYGKIRRQSIYDAVMAIEPNRRRA